MIEDDTLLKLEDAIKNGDVDRIAKIMVQHNLVIKDDKICAADESTSSRFLELSKFYDARQQARKILLNSLYGALLNEAMRLADERMGQSTTLTGRSIVKHMNAEVNKTLTGEYDYIGSVVRYSDTDSCYFTAENIVGPSLQQVEN